MCVKALIHGKPNRSIMIKDVSTSLPVPSFMGMITAIQKGQTATPKKKQTRKEKQIEKGTGPVVHRYVEVRKRRTSSTCHGEGRGDRSGRKSQGFWGKSTPNSPGSIIGKKEGGCRGKTVPPVLSKDLPRKKGEPVKNGILATCKTTKNDLRTGTGGGNHSRQWFKTISQFMLELNSLRSKRKGPVQSLKH